MIYTDSGGNGVAVLRICCTGGSCAMQFVCMWASCNYARLSRSACVGDAMGNKFEKTDRNMVLRNLCIKYRAMMDNYEKVK